MKDLWNYAKAKKNRDSTEDAFTRGFSVEAHGVYNLAHWVYNGELYSEYPDNLEIYKTMLKTEPPVMHLTLPVRKKCTLDVKRFEKELIEEIIRNM